MRPLHVYLAVYVVILAGALLVLWRAGVLGQLPLVWIVLALAFAVCAGIVLLLTAPSRPDAD
ncbi:MAG TPA: hypothetical protein VNK41_13000 [Vicinamibacterales bacterium]|nr:hypothetical protein [Vicinamibacterales bacterium]